MNASHGPDRFEEVKRRFGLCELRDLAGAQGLHRRGSGRNRCECPGCRNGDVRGASLGERDGVGVWRCMRDDSHCGTAVDFLVLAQSISPLEAVVELERVAGIAPSAPTSSPLPVRRPTPPPARPPAAEVASAWALCLPLGLDRELAEAWTARSIDIDHVEDRDLARALPPGARLPRWAFGAGQAWSAGPHRLIVPMFDASGRLASLHARAAAAPQGVPKGLSPAGCSMSGLVMADPLARLLLTGAACGNGEASAEVVRRNDLVVTEGVPDFLSWATRWGDAAEGAPAVLGIVSGSWSEEIAARVPDGTQVVVRQHADKGGAQYTARVVETLAGRCPVSVTVAEEWAPQ